VTVSVAAVAATPAACVSVAGPPAATLVGATVALPPALPLLADNTIVSGVPAVAVVDTVVVPLAPCTTVTVAGDALIEKFGLAFTTTDTVVVCVAAGAVPVMSTVYVPSVVVTPAAPVIVDDPP